MSAGTAGKTSTVRFPAIQSMQYKRGTPVRASEVGFARSVTQRLKCHSVCARARDSARLALTASSGEIFAHISITLMLLKP
jgi:hypothetical protein